MIWAKIKNIALIALGVLVLVLTLGLIDPFGLRKKKEPDTTKKDQETKRETAKAKTDATIYKDLSDLGSVPSGDKRNDALDKFLGKDIPK